MSKQPQTAFTITFPTGSRDVGVGRDLHEAVLYAFRASCQPWCVKPERQEVVELRKLIAGDQTYKGKIQCR